MKSFDSAVESPRVLNRPQTQQRLKSAAEALGAFNEDLSSETPMYEGIVLFSPDAHHTETADAVLSLDGYDVPADDLRFRRSHIDGHRVLLAATALGDLIRERKNLFAASRLNPDAQMTWAGTAYGDDGQPTAIQAAFSMRGGGNLPTNDIMDKLWHHHLGDITEAAHLVHGIVPRGESLGDALELEPPTTPNAFIIRWDIVNSTLPATSGRFGALRSYQQHLEQAFSQILSQEQHVDNYQGDGQNIVFKMTGINYDDPAAIKLFGRQHVEPVVAAMQASHRSIAAHYRDIAPDIRISVGLSYVEEDHRGHLTGPVFSEVAKLPKSTPIALTRAAEAALGGQTKTPA